MSKWLVNEIGSFSCFVSDSGDQDIGTAILLGENITSGVCVCVCLPVSVYMCKYVSVYVCLCVNVCVYVCVCVCICLSHFCV